MEGDSHAEKKPPPSFVPSWRAKLRNYPLTEPQRERTVRKIEREPKEEEERQ